MALQALTLNERVPYVLEFEEKHMEELKKKDPESTYRPTTFYLNHATDQQIAAYRDMRNRGAAAVGSILLVIANLDGWDNLVDEKGNQVDFTESEILRLALEWKYELARKIDDMSDPEPVFR